MRTEPHTDMNPYLKFILVLPTLPFLFLGIIVGLLWHSFMAGVMYSEDLLDKLTSKL